MGIKGTIRSIQAAQRKAQRESVRRQKALEKRHKELLKAEEREQAEYEVEYFNNYLEIITSVHKDCGSEWNWAEIANNPPPVEPKQMHLHEEKAQTALNQFKPGFLDKLLGKTDAKLAELEKAIEEAKKLDESDYQNQKIIYQNNLLDWEQLKDLANRVLADDGEAHLEAITYVNPFQEISELGSSIRFQFDGDLIEAFLKIAEESVIPSETKTVLKTGKLSTKKMPKTKYYELYQDHVCGAVLRVGQELFALLPVEIVIVNAIGNILNTSTGHKEDKTILSIAMPKSTVKSLNFDSLDPSDSLANFKHNMIFKKTSGFQVVEPIKPADLS